MPKGIYKERKVGGMFGKKHLKKTKMKISTSNTGELSSQWKGDLAKYQALHSWIRRHFGVADRCENMNCAGTSKQYQWALRKGKKYSRNKNDYLKLCRSCHQRMDMTDERRKRTGDAHRKYFNCSVIGCVEKHLSRGYCSHHYNVIIRK